MGEEASVGRTKVQRACHPLTQGFQLHHHYTGLIHVSRKFTLIGVQASSYRHSNIFGTCKRSSDSCHRISLAT